MKAKKVLVLVLLLVLGCERRKEPETCREYAEGIRHDCMITIGSESTACTDQMRLAFEMCESEKKAGVER